MIDRYLEEPDPIFCTCGICEECLDNLPMEEDDDFYDEDDDDIDYDERLDQALARIESCRLRSA